MPLPVYIDEATKHLQGSGCVHHSWRQSDAPGISRSRWSNGYCEGVCLDWLRRVLLGGEIQASKKTATYARMQKVYDKAAGLEARFHEHREDVLNKSRENLNTIQKRSPAPLSEARINRLQPDHKLQYWRQDTEHALARLSHATTIVASRATEKIANRQGLLSVAYDFLAKDLDQDFGRKKRSFGCIEVVTGCAPTSFDTVLNLLISAANSPPFEAHTGLLIGFALRDGAKIERHAVCLLNEGGGERYVFFDPNAGTFSKQGRRPIVEASNAFIQNAYRSYGLNPQDEGEWTLFRPVASTTFSPENPKFAMLFQADTAAG
jgi:hypothetical protein